MVANLYYGIFRCECGEQYISSASSGSILCIECMKHSAEYKEAVKKENINDISGIFTSSQEYQDVLVPYLFEEELPANEEKSGKLQELCSQLLSFGRITKGEYDKAKEDCKKAKEAYDSDFWMPWEKLLSLTQKRERSRLSWEYLDGPVDPSESYIKSIAKKQVDFFQQKFVDLNFAVGNLFEHIKELFSKKWPDATSLVVVPKLTCFGSEYHEQFERVPSSDLDGKCTAIDLHPRTKMCFEHIYSQFDGSFIALSVKRDNKSLGRLLYPNEFCIDLTTFVLISMLVDEELTDLKFARRCEIGGNQGRTDNGALRFGYVCLDEAEEDEYDSWSSCSYKYLFNKYYNYDDFQYEARYPTAFAPKA